MQIQRTLVKSPPEIWAEVSDAEALARHLGEFGEIAITRVEPETKVAWEGEHASGTVELTASGWGTKVTLTAETSTAAAPTPPDAELAPADPAAAVVPPRSRWTRLRFWRRPAAIGPTPGPPAPPTPDPSPPGPTPGPPTPPTPDPSPPSPTPEPGPPAPPAPDPPQIRFGGERTEAVLSRVLDDLGQAHHRPFSR